MKLEKSAPPPPIVILPVPHIIGFTVIISFFWFIDFVNFIMPVLLSLRVIASGSIFPTTSHSMIFAAFPYSSVTVFCGT